MSETAIAHYLELRAKLDAKFADIQKKHSHAFQCKLGCHECCKPNLTVNPLEAEVLRRHLKNHPKEHESFGENRCVFLDKQGSCSVYEARPLVCRSHGAPLQFRDPESKKIDEAMRYRDVCPLNFKGEDIAKLSPEDVLNLDTVNTLLALLSTQAYGKEKAQERVSLKSLLNP
jgi:Fe-S-cluster containining protein